MLTPALPTEPWFRAFPKDADGYTLFPAEDAVIISNTADVRDFKSAQQICLQTGRTAILFARGERFTADQINDDIRTNGGSPEKPFVVGATPDIANPMPVLLAGFGIGDAHLPATQNIVLCDLDFYGDSRDPSTENFTAAAMAQSQQAAVRMDATAGGANLWIEGCRVRCFQSGISLESGAPFCSVIVRRNVIDHCWASHFGLYTAGLSDVLIDENWMDHNGWMAGQSGKTILNHNGYLQTSTDPDPQFRVQRNIFARASCFGCQQRPGGVNLNNLYIGNPMAFLLEARDSVDAAGAERSNQWLGQQVLDAVSAGKSVMFPNGFASTADLRAAYELAGKSPWQLSAFEAAGADHAPGMKLILEYYDALIFRGWLRPERTGIEARHASRNDARTHSETAALDSELIDRDLADALTKDVVDELLTLNFGPSARGAVAIDPSPLEPDSLGILRGVLSELLATRSQSAGSKIDVEALLDQLSVPRVTA